MIIYKKGYQVSSSIESAVVTKIKGTTRLNLTKDHPLYNPAFNESKLSLYNRVWDGQDIIYPPKVGDRYFSGRISIADSPADFSLTFLCPPSNQESNGFFLTRYALVSTSLTPATAQTARSNR